MKSFQAVAALVSPKTVGNQSLTFVNSITCFLPSFNNGNILISSQSDWLLSCFAMEIYGANGHSCKVDGVVERQREDIRGKVSNAENY